MPGHDRFPYLASLERTGKRGGEERYCTGALISPSLVLTAAHCVDPSLGGEVSPRVHLARGCNSCENEALTVNRTLTHYKWVRDLRKGADIAILVLNEEVEGPTLKFRQQPSTEVVAAGPLWALGWTVSAGGLKPQHAQLRFVGQQDCRKIFVASDYGNIITKTMICAEAVDTELCSARSGRPLILKGSTWEGDIVVGLSSFGGQECNGAGRVSVPEVFTELASYDADLTALLEMGSLKLPGGHVSFHRPKDVQLSPRESPNGLISGDEDLHSSLKMKHEPGKELEGASEGKTLHGLDAAMRLISAIMVTACNYGIKLVCITAS